MSRLQNLQRLDIGNNEFSDLVSQILVTENRRIFFKRFLKACKETVVGNNTKERILKWVLQENRAH